MLLKLCARVCVHTTTLGGGFNERLLLNKSHRVVMFGVQPVAMPACVFSVNVNSKINISQREARNNCVRICPLGIKTDATDCKRIAVSKLRTHSPLFVHRKATSC